MFIAVLFTITKIRKQPKCPSIHEQIKLWDIYTMEFYSAIKKKKMLLSATVWTDLENIMLSEISQSKKDKSIRFHLYMESNEQTELIRRVGTDSYVRAG